MTDLTHFFNLHRPPNGTFTSQSGLNHIDQQQTTFDINEFPSLSKMSLLSQMQASSRANYVNIAKESTPINPSSADSTNNEFMISSEDFPALPGANNTASTIEAKVANNSTKSSSSTSSSGVLLDGNNLAGTSSLLTPPSSSQIHDGTTAAIDQCGRDNKSYFCPIGSSSQKPMWMNGVDRTNLLSFPSETYTKMSEEEKARLGEFGHGSDIYESSFESPGLTSSFTANSPMTASSIDNGDDPSNSSRSIEKRSVHISNDGRVTNIPSCMVADQFGMIGLLAFLRAAETDPNLASVTFGTDLTALGLNLAAQEKLYPSFAGPWSDRSLNVYEIDYPAPPEYLVSHCVRDKITSLTLKGFHEDTLFFIFYMFPNDMLQILAASELQSREWRFHREEKVWIRRATGPLEKTQTYERGTFYIFDPHNWLKMLREFYLDYDSLENKLSLSN